MARVAPESPKAYRIATNNCLGNTERQGVIMNIFEVTQEFLDEKGFLFLNMEIVSFLQEQVKNGIYYEYEYLSTHSSQCGFVEIDGLKFKGFNDAREYFSQKEEYFILNFNEGRFFHIYKNHKSFEIRDFKDIVNNLKEIERIGTLRATEWIKDDIRILGHFLKYPNANYRKSIVKVLPKYEHSLVNARKMLEKSNEQKRKLREKNVELLEENKTLKNKIKELESKQGDIDKTKKKLKELQKILSDINIDS